MRELLYQDMIKDAILHESGFVPELQSHSDVTKAHSSDKFHKKLITESYKPEAVNPSIKIDGSDKKENAFSLNQFDPCEKNHNKICELCNELKLQYTKYNAWKRKSISYLKSILFERQKKSSELVEVVSNSINKCSNNQFKDYKNDLVNMQSFVMDTNNFIKTLISNIDTIKANQVRSLAERFLFRYKPELEKITSSLCLAYEKLSKEAASLAQKEGEEVEILYLDDEDFDFSDNEDQT